MLIAQILIQLVLIYVAHSKDIYVEIDHQTLPDSEKRPDTFGWFIPALLSLTEESTLHLGQGTHYIQTYEGDSPYYPDEVAMKCSTTWDDIKALSDDAADIFMRRNPLRFTNYENANPGNKTDMQGRPKLNTAVYGATFKITVKSYRCQNGKRCIKNPDNYAILSLANPYITFEVLNEFVLEDLVLTGFESLVKGCQNQECSWCQSHFYSESRVLQCDESQVAADDSWPAGCNGQCFDPCQDAGCKGCQGSANLVDDDFTTHQVCCECDSDDARGPTCKANCSLQRCTTNPQCIPWQPPDEDPQTWPQCCQDHMKRNDLCEAECNYASCNYGNYYRCFPVNPDYMTDCAKLTSISLFTIGDLAYIDSSDEFEALGFDSIPDTGKDINNMGIMCGFWDNWANFDSSNGFMLECSQHQDLLNTQQIGQLSIKDVTIEYFQQEFDHLISFYERDYYDVDKRYICNQNSGLVLDNVKMQYIRTTGPIIYAPTLPQITLVALASSLAIETIELPGSIVLRDVTFEYINTIVPYEQVENNLLPGVLQVQYFGKIQLENVRLEKAAFNLNKQASGHSQDSLNAFVFYFDWVRELTVNRLVAENIYLKQSFLVVKNFLRSVNLPALSAQDGAFLNIPWGTFQYNYYPLCEESTKNKKTRCRHVSDSSLWDDVYCEDVLSKWEGVCWQGEAARDGQTFEGWFKTVSDSELIDLDQGLKQVILSEIKLKNVHMSTQGSKETDIIYLIDISPDVKYSTQFNYYINELKFDQVWDFGIYGGAICIVPNGEAETPSKPIKFPLDPLGNRVSPGITIVNLEADDVLISEFISLRTTIPVEISKVKLDNFVYYTSDQRVKFINNSKLQDLYPTSGTIEQEFDVNVSLILGICINVDRTWASYYESTGRQDGTQASDTDVTQDPLQADPSVTLYDCDFKDIMINESIIKVVVSDIVVQLDDMIIKDCSCPKKSNKCKLFEILLSQTDSIYTDLTFSRNSSVDEGVSTVIDIQTLEAKLYQATFENLTINQWKGFNRILYSERLVAVRILNSELFNNEAVNEIISQSVFAQNHIPYAFVMNQVVFEDNKSEDTFTISIGPAFQCQISVEGGSYIGNDGGVFQIECTNVNEVSSITSAVFNDNNYKGPGTDIQFIHNQGILIIQSCTFEASVTSSLSFEGQPPNTSQIPLYIEDIQALADNFPQVQITQCIFQNFGASFINSIGRTYVVILSQQNTFQNNHGNIKISKSAFIDQGSIFENNIINELIRIRENSDLVLIDSEFKNNKSNIGLLDIMQSRLLVMRSKFSGNYSSKSSGWMFLYYAYNATIIDTEFYNNTAEEYGSIMFASLQMEPDTVAITFSGCQFIENHAKTMSGIQLTFVNMRLDNNWVFRKNSADIYPGIYLFYATAEIYDSTFEDQTSPEAAFLRGIYSNAIIYNSHFTKADGTEATVLKMSDNSYISLTSSSIKNSQSKNGVMYVQMNSQMIINDLKVDKVSSSSVCSFLYCDKSELDIQNSQFSNTNHTALSVNGDSILRLSNSIFENSTSVSTGGFIQISQSQFDIQSVEFKNGTALYGGAIAVIDGFTDTAQNRLLDIRNSKFLNNSAQSGGAIYLQSDIRKIDNSEFFGNSAINDNQEGYGGALMYSCTTSCEMIIKECNFTKNQASEGGGGIYWTENPPNSINVTSQGNSARFGADTSSPPARIAYTPPNGSTSRQLSDTYKELNDLFQNMASGQRNGLNITIAILDYDGNVVTSKSNYTATFEGINGTQLQGTVSAISNQGLMIFDDLQVIKEPGTQAQIKLTTDAVSNLGVNTASEIKLDFYMRECIIGERIDDNKCRVCDLGGKRYTFEAGAEDCEDWPDGARCLGGATLYPLPGYWRSSWNSSNFYQCHVEVAWLGGVKTENVQGECDEDIGYSGPKCTVCIDDYTRVGKYQCAKCPNENENILILVAILIAVMLMITIILNSNLKAASQKRREIIGKYIKIMTNYFQIVVLVQSFKLDWPSFVLDYFETQDEVGTASDRMFSFDWYLQKFGGIVFYWNLCIVAILPIIIIIVSTTIWAIYGALKESFRYSISIKNRAWILVAFFLIHPNLIRLIFVSFSWEQIDDKEYLQINMSEEWWVGDHLLYVLTISIPSFILWGIGLPALAMMMLRRHYVSKTLLDVSTLSIYGFLYNGYKFRTYYWELIILYRKISIVFVLVFLGIISFEVQALVALFIMMASLIFHMNRQPFETQNLNQLETLSIMSAAVTIYLGLYFLSDSLNEATKIVFFIIIVFVNINFFITWLRMFLMEFTQKMRRNHQKQFDKIFKGWLSEKHLLKFDKLGDRNLPIRKISHSNVMQRRQFLKKQLWGSQKSVANLTDKQFKQILSNKGSMLMSLMDKTIKRQNEDSEVTTLPPKIIYSPENTRHEELEESDQSYENAEEGQAMINSSMANTSQIKYV